MLVLLTISDDSEPHPMSCSSVTPTVEISTLMIKHGQPHMMVSALARPLLPCQACSCVMWWTD